MKEVLYVIAGKRLPVVFHVGARALTSQALNIHAGHDDVMAVADTGWGILFARNAQEAADLTAIARRVAEATETPFFVVQDGFLTTHTLENARLPEDELLREFVGDPRAHPRPVRPGRRADDRRRPEPGQLHEGPDRPARLLRPRPGGSGRAFAEWAADRPPLRPRRRLPLRGRRRDPRRHGHDRRHGDRRRRPPPRARAAGRLRRRHELPARSRPRRSSSAAATRARRRSSSGPTSRAAADNPPDPRDQGGALRRGAPRAKSIGAARPCRCRPGLGTPRRRPGRPRRRLRLAGRAWRPGDALRRPRHPPSRWRSSRPPSTCGRRAPSRCAATRSAASAAVTTNKLVATLVGELFGKDVQAYPRYGSEKKGLPTTYYLTIADEPIRQHAELDQVDFVPLHDVSAFGLGRSARRPGRRRRLSSSRRCPTRGHLGVDPRHARAEILARRIRGRRARHGRPRPTPCAPRRTSSSADAGRRPGRRLPARTPVRRAAGLGPRRLLTAVDRLGPFFGKRGEPWSTPTSQ